MDYLCNTFSAEQDTVRMSDFFKISSSILKRELTSQEKEQLMKLVPSTSIVCCGVYNADGMVEKVRILSLIYRISDRAS